jgi:hypothetical protein
LLQHQQNTSQAKSFVMVVPVVLIGACYQAAVGARHALHIFPGRSIASIIVGDATLAGTAGLPLEFVARRSKSLSPAQNAADEPSRYYSAALSLWR